jgi:alpha-glucosidase
MLGFLIALAGAATAVASVDGCPGYQVTNVVQGSSFLQADLTLAGTACNALSVDLPRLKLLVEYQTGKPLSSFFARETGL